MFTRGTFHLRIGLLNTTDGDQVWVHNCLKKFYNVAQLRIKVRNVEQPASIRLCRLKVFNLSEFAVKTFCLHYFLVKFHKIISTLSSSAVAMRESSVQTQNELVKCQNGLWVLLMLL